MKSRRSGLLAVLLHGLAPGLGFLYAGKMATAFFIPVLMLAWILALGWSRVLLEPQGIAVLWLGLLLFYFSLMPVVFIVSRQQGFNKQNRSFYYAAFGYIAFVLWLLVLIVVLLQFRATLLGYETFRLPSRSMEATLMPGDYIVVDTWIYQKSTPKRGDVIVFKNPLDGRNFTKRVIGMPGEKVSIKGGIVSINNRVLKEPYVSAHNNKLTAQKEFPEYTVPAGYYFMLGDNRDHSNDSRSWGFLSSSAILGKVTSIWFSFSGQFRAERIRAVQ